MNGQTASKTKELMTYLPEGLRNSRPVHVGLRGVDHTMFNNAWKAFGGAVPMCETVACCDYGRDHRAMLRNGTMSVISLEESRGYHADWSTDDIEGIPALNGFRRLVAERDMMHLVLLPFKTVHALEELRGEKNVTLAGATYENVHFLDNKINLPGILKTKGIEPIPGENVERGDFNPESFARLQERYGRKLVAQIAYGSGGSGTYFVSTYEEALKVFNDTGAQTVKMSRFINGPSMNGHACVVETTEGPKTMVFNPSFQIIGAPELSDWPTYYCGNDYTGVMGMLGEKGVAEYKEIMGKIGDYAATRGWKGAIGMDFIFNPEERKVYVVEINPRLQSSTSILHQFGEEAGQVGIGTMHLVAHLADRPIPVGLVQQGLVEMSGSHVLINNRTGADAIVQGELDSGLYHINGGLTRIQSHYWAQIGPDEFLVTCGVPENGTRVENHGTILKVYSRMGALAEDGTHLSESMARITDSVYRALRLE